MQAYLAAALYKQGTTPVDKFGELASLREQVKAMLMKQPWFATLGGMGHHHGMGGQTLSVDARNVLAAAAGDVPPILLELLRMHPPGAAPLMGPLDSLFSQMGPPPLTGLVNHPLPVPAGLPTAASGGLPMAPPIPAPTALPPTALAGLQPGSAAAVTSGGGLLRPAPKKPHGEQGLAQQTLSDLGVGGDPAKQAAGATAPRLVTAVGSRFQPYNSAPQAGGAAGSADVKEESTVAGGGPPLAEGEGGTQADGDQALAGQRGSQELRQAIFDQMAANSAGADAGAGAGSGPASGSPAWKPSAILDALK